MILQMNQDYHQQKRKDMVDLDFHHVAFAEFPVRVVRQNLPHTLPLD
jgi:hypothetical protein